MKGVGHSAVGLWCVAGVMMVSGCDRGGSEEASVELAVVTEKKAELTVLAAESEGWSREEALARLGDEELGVSAAVRLVRVAGVRPLCVPEGLSDRTASRLRLVQLAENAWALGVVDRKSERVLHAPVLIGGDGEVFVVAGGTEEETLTLHVSEDADVFPHLLITPREVLIGKVPPERALRLKSPATVGFERREEEGFGYVGLMLAGEAGKVEVGRYVWEPFELGFMGPAADGLPEPPGGKFVLDMGESPLLIPMGGEIPEPEPTQPEPPGIFEWDSREV